MRKATIKFNEWPNTIYRYIGRYDGSFESSEDYSRSRYYHPIEKIKLINNYKANNKDTGLAVLWVKLR